MEVARFLKVVRVARLFSMLEKIPFWQLPRLAAAAQHMIFVKAVTLGVTSGSECSDCIQRKNKGQQLKGKIASALFHTFGTFPHIFTLPQSFSEFFLQGLFLRIKGFY